MALPTLPLFVLGLIYFFGATPFVTLAAPFNPVANVDKELVSTERELVHFRRDEERPQIRRDYTYTRSIGGHKVHNVAAKWNEARAICKAEGGDLAIVNSEAESRLLVRLLTESKPHSGSVNSDYAFIGFHDLFGEGQFETVDGKSLSDAGFMQWAAGEPDNGRGNIENCGTIYKDGNLSDASCSKFYAAVCELPVPHFPEGQAPPDNEEDISIDELIDLTENAWEIWESKRTTTTTEEPSNRDPPSRLILPKTRPVSSHDYSGFDYGNSFSSQMSSVLAGTAGILGAIGTTGLAGLPLMMG